MRLPPHDGSSGEGVANDDICVYVAAAADNVAWVLCDSHRLGNTSLSPITSVPSPSLVSPALSAVYDTSGNQMTVFGGAVARTKSDSVPGSNPNADSTSSDRLTNSQEIASGTDPLNPDTDGDGYPNVLEVLLGSNPLDDILPVARENAKTTVGPEPLKVEILNNGGASFTVKSIATEEIPAPLTVTIIKQGGANFSISSIVRETKHSWWWSASETQPLQRSRAGKSAVKDPRQVLWDDPRQQGWLLRRTTLRSRKIFRL
jgi:hypothetical protein